MAATAGTKRRWAIATAGAAAGVLALVALFRPPTIAPLPVMNPGKPPVTLNPGRPDELAMQDLSPLFLPTPYNTAPETVEAREPGASFSDPQPKWKFSEENPALPMPAPVRVPERPADVVAESAGPLAFGIGRTNRAVAPAPAHGAYVEVFADESGGRVLAQTLPPSARPGGEARETTGWHPLEFVAAVDAMGVVGPVTLTASSGAEEVDDFFRTYLVRTFRMGDRLSPGFYRVVIGP